jgi:hypothetical protein
VCPQIIFNPQIGPDPCGTCTNLIHHLSPTKTTLLKMNPLLSTHTSGAAAASIMRASVDTFASALVLASASSASEAPHVAVSACVSSPPASTPLLMLSTSMPSSPSGWSGTNNQTTTHINLPRKDYILQLTRFSSSIFCIQYSRPCLVHQFFTSFLAIQPVFMGKSQRSEALQERASLFTFGRCSHPSPASIWKTPMRA